MIEQIANGTASTSFMKVGDRIQIEMKDRNGQSIFGLIDQTVKPAVIES
jgi:fumarylacetoacetate (FAA) hydrolase